MYCMSTQSCALHDAWHPAEPAEGADHRVLDNVQVDQVGAPELRPPPRTRRWCAPVARLVRARRGRGSCRRWHPGGALKT